MKTFAVMTADGRQVIDVFECESEANIIDRLCENFGEGMRNIYIEEFKSGRRTFIEVASVDEAYWLRDEINRPRFDPPAQGNLFAQEVSRCPTRRISVVPRVAP